MRVLLLGLSVAIAALVVVDYGAAAHAEYDISRTLRADQGLPLDPDVRIANTPFLVVLATGHYRQVDVRAAGVIAPGVGPVTLESTLRDVRLGAGAAAAGTIADARAGQVTSRVRIDATTLGQFLGVPDLQLSAPAAELSDGTGGSGGSGRTTTDGSVVLTGSVDVPGLSGMSGGGSGDGESPGKGQTEGEEVSVRAELSVVDSDVVVRAVDLARGSPGGSRTNLDPTVRQAVLDRFARTVPVGRLPFGVPPTGVRAQGSEIVLEGKGTDVLITEDSTRTYR